MEKTMKKLQVWWIPQVPMNTSFYVDVPDLKTAKLVLDMLANYDAYQYDNNIKPDYSNAGGLQEWDEQTNEWIDWWDDETGMDFDEYIESEEYKEHLKEVSNRLL